MRCGKKNQEILFIFLEKSEEEISELLPSYPEIKNALSKHLSSFYWLGNSYFHAEALDEKYFINSVSNLLKAKKNIYAEIVSILDAPNEDAIRKKDVSEKLNLDSEFLAILSIIGKNAWLHDTRKMNSMKGHFFLSRFLSEFSRRNNIPVDYYLLCLPHEIIPLFTRQLLPSAIKGRKTASATLFAYDSIENIQGESAKSFKAVLSKSGHENPGDVHGLCASPGKTAGTVKILLKIEDMKKMNDGDIILSPMTRPDLVPAMKKAAAIVTDEGGMLCHAAIVSREMKIPCIVGTAIATKVLKTGDLIEVDATKGRIFVLEKIRIG